MFRPAIIAVLCVTWIAAAGCRRSQPETAAASAESKTGYSAVLLSNGNVYFGKLEGLGTAYPVLREVYYVQSNVDPQTKAVSNILIKRGKEWHGPDRMIINEKSIVFVEPVGPGSKVAELIAESKK